MCVGGGNGIHSECFAHWARSKQGCSAVPCPLCRAAWPVAAGGKARVGAEGFVNLAAEAGVSAHRPSYYGYGNGYGYGTHG